MGTVSLTGFLAARYDELEAAAKAAERRFPSPWQHADMTGASLPFAVSLYDSGDESLAVVRGSYAAQHIALHDPARVLREVEAMRAVLALYAETAAVVSRAEGRMRHAMAPPPGSVANLDRLDGGRELAVLHRVISSLAAVFDQHPDYRQDWSPA